MHKLSSYRRIV